MNQLTDLIHSLTPCPAAAERDEILSAYGDEAILHLHTKEALREAHKTIALLGRELLHYEAQLAMRGEGR